MKDYTTAISNSTSLINTGKYPLLNSEDGGEAFRNMWVKDTGSEVIWQIYMSADELGSATGTSFWGQYKKDDPSSQVMDYIPSQKLIDLYEQDRDIRFAAYFARFCLGRHGHRQKQPGHAKTQFPLRLFLHPHLLSRLYRRRHPRLRTQQNRNRGNQQHRQHPPRRQHTPHRHPADEKRP